MQDYNLGLDFAIKQDNSDELAHFRNQLYLPRGKPILKILTDGDISADDDTYNSLEKVKAEVILQDD